MHSTALSGEFQSQMMKKPRNDKEFSRLEYFDLQLRHFKFPSPFKGEGLGEGKGLSNSRPTIEHTGSH